MKRRRATKHHPAVPAKLIADMQVWRAATQIDPSDLRPSGATPARPGHPNLPAATRQATRRPGYQRRPAMAADARHRSPQRHRRPIPARADRKVEQPHPGRLRRHPPRAVGGRRRTATRRPSRRSPLVAHPRPATANAEPETHNANGCPSDQAHAHDGARAALEAASGVRPEPLTRPPDRSGNAGLSGPPTAARR